MLVETRRGASLRAATCINTALKKTRTVRQLVGLLDRLLEKYRKDRTSW